MTVQLVQCTILIMMKRACCCTGGLDVKILPRTAKLDGAGAATGPPPEQDIPLDIPKRTAAYIAQVQILCNVS